MNDEITLNAATEELKPLVGRIIQQDQQIFGMKTQLEQLTAENERLVARVVELEAALRQVVNYAHESHCNYVTLQGVVIYYRHVPETVVNAAAEMVGMSDWKEIEL